MPAFLNSDLGELSHQLTLSPKRLRVEQLAGIESVLSIVTPDKAYPFEWVCYKITKYHKRGPETGAMIPGKALIADLVTMGEQISRKANLSVSAFTDPYWTQEEVASELHVSTKTIRRWRRRGLLGIRAVFEDGVNRLIFPRHGVKRFADQNKQLVEKAASFKQLTGAERDHIIALAREFVRERGAKLHETAKLIAQETGRAVETIRYTLRRFDQAHKQDALFTRQGAHSSFTSRQRAIWKAYKAGDSPDSIAHAFDCSAADIRRTLNELKVRSWKDKPIEFIHNELFDAPDADGLILHVPEPEPMDVQSSTPPRDVPAYLRSLYRTPLLSAALEADLFRRYNYVKYKVARRLHELDPRQTTDQDVAAIEKGFDQANELRRRIVQANLRLVVSIAKKHVGWSSDFFEVISDGNMSLMRAVERFDYARGHRFSTYATWAIMKNYARSIPEERYHVGRFVTGQDEMLAATPDHRAAIEVDGDLSRVRDLLREGLATLNEREREVVKSHFGLFQQEGENATLEEIGRRFGVTKERVRQIEKRAIGKLRKILPPSLANALTA